MTINKTVVPEWLAKVPRFVWPGRHPIRPIPPESIVVRLVDVVVAAPDLTALRAAVAALETYEAPVRAAKVADEAVSTYEQYVEARQAVLDAASRLVKEEQS